MQLADYTRYGVCQQMCPGGCPAYHDDGEGGRRLLNAGSSEHKPGWIRGTRRGGSCGGSSPGRFITTGLFSEVDSPGEYYYHKQSKTLYFYPPQKFFDSGADVNAARIDIWKNRNEFVKLSGSKYVTVRGFTIRGIESKDAIKVTGGSNNVIGGNTIKSCGNAITLDPIWLGFHFKGKHSYRNYQVIPLKSSTITCPTSTRSLDRLGFLQTLLCGGSFSRG